MLNIFKNLRTDCVIVDISYFHGFIKVHAQVKIPKEWTEEILLDNLNFWCRRDNVNFPKVFSIKGYKKMSLKKIRKDKKLLELEMLNSSNCLVYNKFPRVYTSTNMHAIFS